MGNKKTTNILLAVMGVLILAEFAAAVFTINRQNIIRSICKIISLTFIALYGFVLYKKAHGNILKYAMLLLGISEIITAAQCIRFALIPFYLNVVWIFVAVVLVYVAGRLNKVKQNKYLLGLAAIAQFLVVVVCIVSAPDERTPMRFFTWFSGEISIITLMIAYFVRFQDHMEAGLKEESDSRRKRQ